MTQKEKKILLDELERAYYQAFSYKKAYVNRERNLEETVILTTQNYAENLAKVCKMLGLKTEADLTIAYTNKLVYGR